MKDFVISPLVVTALLAAIGIIFAIGTWVGSVNSDRKSFREFMKEIQNEISKIHDSIESILVRLPPTTIARSSPLTLTSLGQHVSQELDARGWAERTAPTLADRAEGQDPYTIQEACFKYVADEFQPDADMEAKIRSSAFENGIDRDQVVRVLAVELRDQLLEGYLPEET